MKELVDARGLACPQPVLLTKKALESKDEITVLVDNITALENIKRFAKNAGCSVDVVEETGYHKINIVKQQGASLKETSLDDITCKTELAPQSARPVVIVLSSNKMGSGDDELGIVLMRSFIHTLTEMDKKPDIIILYNSGVKLAIEGSDVLHDLDSLMSSGVKILVCGTCLNFFNVKDKLKAGSVSNMFEITETLLTAKNIIRP